MAKSKAAKPVAPAAEPVVLVGRAVFEAYLSPTQCDAVDAFGALCAAKVQADGTFTDRAHALVGEIFPKPCDFTSWKPIAKGIRVQYGDRARSTFSTAYKTLHGALPSAGTGSGEGTKGMSPKRAANTLLSRVGAVFDYMATLRKVKANVNAAALDNVATAVNALMEACQALKASVNE